MTSKIAEELKKRASFESLEQEVTLNIWRTADRLDICFSRLFRSHGITPSQYNILRILRGHGAPLPCLEIAARTVTAVPGITGLIDRLEKAKLVSRARSATDRRVINVEITVAGLDVLNNLDSPVSNLHREVLGHLAEMELSQLNALLVKAREKCP